jgi:hypothetical protein
MFQLAAKREILWPVTIQVPVDGGGVEKKEIQLRLRIFSRSEKATYLEQLRTAASTEGATVMDVQRITTDELASRITGWENVLAEDDQPAPFTPENVAALLDIECVFTAAHEALLAASQGALAKN